MSFQFRWHPDESEIDIPQMACYPFPSQNLKAVKSTPKIAAKNGEVFGPGSAIILEFPSQGYVNGLNTTISFDVTLLNGNILSTDKSITMRFQNNVFKK